MGAHTVSISGKDAAEQSGGSAFCAADGRWRLDDFAAAWAGSLLGGLAEKLGFEIVFHQPAIVVAMLFVTFPFVIRAVQPLLEELDPLEEEAAYTMGASRTRTFFKVILPSMLPGIISGGMLAFSRALAEFGAVVLVAGNIPAGR